LSWQFVKDAGSLTNEAQAQTCQGGLSSPGEASRHTSCGERLGQARPRDMTRTRLTWQVRDIPSVALWRRQDGPRALAL